MSNKKENDITLEEKINHVIDDVIDWFKNLLSGKDSSDRVLNIFLTIIVMFILLWLLKIPFIILSSMGKSLIIFTFSPLDTILVVLWEVMIQLAYLVFAVFIIITAIKRIRFGDEHKSTKSKKKVVNETKTTEEKKVVSNSQISIGSTFRIILKVVMAIFIVPFIIFNIFLFMILGVLVGLWVKGTLLIGAIFIIVGIFLIMISVMGMILKLLSEGEGEK
jgi:hypothetical protein